MADSMMYVITNASQRKGKDGRLAFHYKSGTGFVGTAKIMRHISPFRAPSARCCFRKSSLHFLRRLLGSTSAVIDFPDYELN